MVTDDEGVSERRPRRAKKSAPWWKRDAGIPKAKSEWETWFMGKKRELLAAKAKMDNTMKSDFVNSPSVEPWKATCSQRLKALSLVVSEDADAAAKMQEYIAGFDGESKLGASVGNSSSGGRISIGAAPPCARYATPSTSRTSMTRSS